MSLTSIFRSSAVALAATLGLGFAAQADTYKWITFKPQGAGDAQAVTTQWLVDEFEKRTGGKHKIEVFWGGSVAKTREIPEALAAGVGDFGDIITPYFPDLMPLNNAVGFFIPQPMKTLQVGGGGKLAAQNHFDGRFPLQNHVSGPIDDSHPATGQFFQ